MSNRINLDFASPEEILNGAAMEDIPKSNTFDPDFDTYETILAKQGITEVNVPWSPDGKPDWISFSVGAGGDMGGSVTVTIDRWNRMYYSTGGSSGIGSGVISGAITFGCVSSDLTGNARMDLVNDFQNSAIRTDSVSAGAVLGMSVSWTIVDGKTVYASDFGIMTPQAGVSSTSGGEVPIPGFPKEGVETGDGYTVEITDHSVSTRITATGEVVQTRALNNNSDDVLSNGFNSHKVEQASVTRTDPNSYYIEFELKPGDGWDRLEAIYSAAIRDLPEYGTIQPPGVKFQIEVSGSKLAELYYSGKLRPGDRGFAIIRHGGGLSHLSAHFGEEITPDSLAKGNGIEKDWVHLGQSITVFSFQPNSIHSNPITAHSDDTNTSRWSLTAQNAEEFDAKVAMLKAELTLAENQRLQSGAAQTLTTNEMLMTDTELLESIREGILSSEVLKVFAEQWEYNLKLIQGPTSTVSFDATLSYEDIKRGYTLSSINGVLRRVNAAGAMHPDDQYADWEQGEMFERATLRTIADMRNSSLLSAMNRDDSNQTMLANIFTDSSGETKPMGN